ncbi:hypothetical protein [Thauera sinica]|uniref:Uncharacterized protein n=1 Tax=Thauera sinica TaxID=2665146 RepID=A0ABW1ARP7_9RHOO|nr:hypothetical protein [Thauera sp. K11]
MSSQDFPDKTGYECFVNSVHIDDYVSAEYLTYAFIFVEDCFASWEREGRNESLLAIVVCDEFGAVVKLHVARDGESWTGNDLEKYEEGILIVREDKVRGADLLSLIQQG